MKAIKNLTEIMQNLSAILNEGEYVFCSIPTNSLLPEVKFVASFYEAEGTTLIIERTSADKLHLKYDTIMSWITLNVFSSLDAVGLTAVISTALAKNNISCNIIAAFYHDHIFVPKQSANKALILINGLMKTS